MSEHDERTLSMVANAIGWGIYAGDGRPVEPDESGEVGVIHLNDVETELCKAAAGRVLDTLTDRSGPIEGALRIVLDVHGYLHTSRRQSDGLLLLAAHGDSVKAETFLDGLRALASVVR